MDTTNSTINISIDIYKYIVNGTIELRVTPNAKKEQLIEENTKPHLYQLHLYIQAQPQDNKANLAVIKFFKKNYKLKVRIKFGEKSRDKVLEMI